MNRSLLPALLLGLGACVTSKDDVAKIPTLPQEPVDRTTSTTCGLYAKASTQSDMLATVDTGARIQVLDSTNAYFVRARLNQNGKTVTGYMYRACLTAR